MKSRISIAVVGLAALCSASVAMSQDLGALKNAATGSLGSLMPGSAGNAAGLLQFCIGNNYLSGGDASSMKDKLLAKAGGADVAQTDTGYKNGAEGILAGSDGKDVDLTKLGSLESNLTQQACSSILKNASSLL